MRLGFAISTSFQHDVILMDEWVGAGDADFMAKATERMQSRVNGSKIVMLASHSVGLLRDVCNKGIVLERGRLIFGGGIVDALQCYHESLARPTAHAVGRWRRKSEERCRRMAYGAIERIIDRVGRRACHRLVRRVPTACRRMALCWRWRDSATSATGIERLAAAGCGASSGSEPRRNAVFVRVSRLPADSRGGSSWAAGLRMLAGDSPARAHSPLRIAPTLAAALHGASKQ